MPDVATFVEHGRATGTGTWHKIAESQSYASWSGSAFESVCRKHVQQIKAALGIEGIYTEVSPWRHAGKKGASGAQIDLLLDRRDHCINMCETKFSSEEYVIDKKYAAELDNKPVIFKDKTKTKKAIFPTMITPYGTKQNIYYTGRITSEVTMKDLFK